MRGGFGALTKNTDRGRSVHRKDTTKRRAASARIRKAMRGKMRVSCSMRSAQRFTGACLPVCKWAVPCPSRILRSHFTLCCLTRCDTFISWSKRVLSRPKSGVVSATASIIRSRCENSVLGLRHTGRSTLIGPPGEGSDRVDSLRIPILKKKYEVLEFAKTLRFPFFFVTF